ncbi:MAG TPA: hypothetical protein VM582_01265 [Candidatus Thermoplasmatota archaeon]|nr:hypothetical protein [Candidatus Thermoplasmatota archaeon]
MSKALLWAPDERGALELIAKARELQLEPVVLSIGLDAKKLVQHGAATVLVVDDAKAKDMQSGPVADALAAAVQETRTVFAPVSCTAAGAARRSRPSSARSSRRAS